MKTIIAAIAILASTAAHAGSSFYHGSNGQSVGNSINSGNSTFYYNNNGGYEGMAITPSRPSTSDSGPRYNPMTNRMINGDNEY